MTNFRAPWSRALIAVSLLTSLGCLIATAFISQKMYPFAAPAITSVTLLLIPLIPLLAAPFAITGYSLRGSTLFIRRPFWTTTISLNDLQKATAAPEALKRSWRLCGNGGLFSFTGWFSSPALGVYRAYLTDPKNTVVLYFSNRKIVISPHDPTAFCEAVRTISEPRG